MGTTARGSLAHEHDRALHATVSKQPISALTSTSPAPTRRRVLVTGAAGQVGRLVATRLADRYDLTLTDIRSLPSPSTLPFTQADIADLEVILPLCQGIDTVLHLATANMHASWESLLPSNIVGAYNIFLAAHAAGCRRVVFTSSIQAVDGAAPELVVPSGAPAQPSTLYGATKAWGEAAGSFFARQYGYSVICLRLGWVASRDSRYLWPGSPDLPRAITQEDLVSLLIAAVEAPADLRFAVLNGLSSNRQMRLEISKTRRLLGYVPQDDAFLLAEHNYPTPWHRGLRRVRSFARRARQRTGLSWQTMRKHSP
ncbi:MAG: NAD(P)-dependent oxidoreductase [Chloroflexi bacterium]|nr:NAD(P)-dependent oxidoreductase [Chloroflexota bacterium]